MDRDSEIKKAFFRTTVTIQARGPEKASFQRPYFGCHFNRRVPAEILRTNGTPGTGPFALRGAAEAEGSQKRKGHVPILPIFS